ncbi:hypothetical protein ZYGR_0AD05330 [Zygosaccharomyces rouxii]|uniref:Cell wall mannoprotein PIR1-like C-terminal domain-containing protein n=1 Tax=Zygosaccharomyces rouxii TaxID=4956 RepID=A0A1Q3A6Z4_ZYGRO|nr:hypothetical protein ZYGR_0AD05330 [Zygosaccharomyces rouxii]
MQFKSTLASAALTSSALAHYGADQSWSTLTPSGTYQGAKSSYSATFGIAVQTIANSSTHTASQVKRAAPVTQIGDGQIQATTATPSPSPKPSAQPISQIGDGQIQATTGTPSAKPSAQPISQIGDGQIQATTGTSSKPSAQPVSQIGDGQIQATTRTTTSCSTTSAKPSENAASQIADGQVQATGNSTRTTLSPSSNTDAAPSLTTSAGAVQTAASDGVAGAQACKNNGTLQLKLEDGILHDIKGRIGSIVSNHQFQFDGPPPQAGAIYAGGWSITPEGNLALGQADVFYQCLSGNFYNLYDQSIGDQCHPVHLEVLELVDC